MLEDHVGSECSVDHLLGQCFAIEKLECTVNGPGRIFAPVDRFALEEESHPANELAKDDHIAE